MFLFFKFDLILKKSWEHVWNKTDYLCFLAWLSIIENSQKLSHNLNLSSAPGLHRGTVNFYLTVIWFSKFVIFHSPPLCRLLYSFPTPTNLCHKNKDQQKKLIKQRRIRNETFNIIDFLYQNAFINDCWILAEIVTLRLIHCLSITNE